MMRADNRKIMSVLVTGIVLPVLIWLSVAPLRADPAYYPVSIVSAEGAEFVYQLELAITPEARSKGLMFRTEMPDDAGMLFVWPDEKKRSFWMKNTPLSLDILFFSADKTLLTSHQFTTPFSEAYLSSGGPAAYVVELKAGQVQKNGLHAGSILRLPERLESRLAR